MMMKKLLASVLGALAFAGAANAAVLTSFDAASGNVVADYSTGGLVAFDLDLAQLRNTTLTYTIEAADLAGPTFSFNALLRNLSGAGLRQFGIRLDGISFAGLEGSITPAFGTVGDVTAGAGGLRVDFSTPEWAELQVGNPFGDAGLLDWQLSTAGLSVGDTFTIAAEVPEPGNAGLMLVGLAAAGMVARRRRRA